MDRRRFFEVGAAAAGSSLLAPARSTASPPTFGIVIGRVTLLAELVLLDRMFDRARCSMAALRRELALLDRMFDRAGCGMAALRRELPDPGEEPLFRGLDEVTLAPGQNGCRLFAGEGKTEYHAVLEAECSGKESVSVPPAALCSWLAAAGEHDGPVVLRRLGANEVEAQFGNRRRRIPARTREAESEVSGSPPARRTSPPAGARLLPGLDGSWFPDYLRVCADNFPSTEITVPQVMDRLESEAIRRDRIQRLVFSPGGSGAPKWNPAQRKPKVSLVLLFETMFQWMVIARAVGGPDRVLHDGERVFFESTDRLLVSPRLSDSFQVPWPFRGPLGVGTGDTWITTFSMDRLLAEYGKTLDGLRGTPTAISPGMTL